MQGRTRSPVTLTVNSVAKCHHHGALEVESGRQSTVSERSSIIQQQNFTMSRQKLRKQRHGSPDQSEPMNVQLLSQTTMEG